MLDGDAPKKSAIVPCVRSNMSLPPVVIVVLLVIMALSLNSCTSLTSRSSPFNVAVVRLAKVAGEPVCKAGIRATSGLLKSRSSSAREFRLASPSIRVTGISSPELHSSSMRSMEILPNAKLTRIVVGVSL